MTDEERRMLIETAASTKRLEEFFFEPRHPGERTRAERLDGMFDAIKAGKITARVVFGVLGLMAAMGAAWASVRGWLPWSMRD